MVDFEITEHGTLLHYNGKEQHVAIPYSVQSIGGRAFFCCPSLTSITIPASVTSIGEMAFFCCVDLTSIMVDAGNAVYSSEDGVLYNKAKTILIQYPQCKKGAYSIPDSVTSIRASAFSVCSSLTSVVIGNSVTSIGDGAFYCCTGLTSITADKGNAVYSSEDGVLYNKAKTVLIRYPEGKKGAYSIPDSVTGIGESAFSGCSSLTSVAMPDSVIDIGKMAFSGCSGLTSIAIPGGVMGISELAFSGCSGLISVAIPDRISSIGDGVFFCCAGLTSIAIPDSVSSIGNGAFAYCSGLTSVAIPGGVMGIGNTAFAYCSGLTNITVDAGNAVYSSEDGVLFNKAKTVLIRYPEGKKGAYSIPDSVTSIGDGAFFCCAGLTSIMVGAGNAVYSSEDGVLFNKAKTVLIRYPEGKTCAYSIPDSVKIIGESAFSNCSGLTNVVIGNSVTNIGDEAFTESGLTNVTIPDSVTSIGNDAFAYCDNLTCATISDNVMSIGDDAFKSYNSLTIKGKQGSYADEYASRNSIPFSRV